MKRSYSFRLLIAISFIGLQGCGLGASSKSPSNSNSNNTTNTSYIATINISKSIVYTYSGQSVNLSSYISGGYSPYTYSVTSGVGTFSGSTFTSTGSNFIGSGTVTVQDSKNNSGTVKVYVLGSPLVWLDASNLGLSNMSSVSQWTDMSGSNRNFIQNTSSNQPTFRTGILGGKYPVVSFCNASLSTCNNNSGTFLSYTGSLNLATGTGTGTTVFAVMQLSDTSVTNANAIISRGTNDIALLAYGNPPTLSLTKSGGSNVAVENTAMPSGFQIAYSTFDGTNGTLYRNGGSVANGISDSLVSGSLSVSNSGNTTSYIGKDPNGGGTLTGDVAEMIAIPGVRTSQNMQTVISYFQAKYGASSFPGFNWTYGSQLYSSYGTNNYTVPNGVYDLTVSLIGAGGSGDASCGANTQGGGGGGGGAFGSSIYAVTPQQVYSVVVGQGGGMVAYGGTSGNPGGNSTFSGNSVTQLTAGGGGVGTCNSGIHSTSSGAGGTGSGPTGATTYSGGGGGGSAYYSSGGSPGGGGGGGAAGRSGTGSGGSGTWGTSCSCCGCNNYWGGAGGNGSGGAAGGLGSPQQNSYATPGTSVTLSNLLFEGGGGSSGSGGNVGGSNGASTGGSPGGGGGGSSGYNPSEASSGADGAALIEYRLWQ